MLVPDSIMLFSSYFTVDLENPDHVEWTLYRVTMVLLLQVN